jgi:hypothetical protein
VKLLLLFTGIDLADKRKHSHCLLDLQGSFGAFVVFDLSKPFPTECLTFPEVHVRDKRRKRALPASEVTSEDVVEPTQCKLCLHYNSMLHMDYVGPDELLVVEQPWLNVVATFPAALQRRAYGS